MTYYAVTNDPNELMHFGIKGMKWGVIRTPEQLGHHKSTSNRSRKPRSPAYLKASAKLSRSMQAGIAKAQANWKAYNSPAQKAQRAENRAINKQIRDYKRNEKAFQKHLELARQGRLRYKGISDAEVSRITDRLALERSSRLLSGTEKQSFGRRLKEKVGEGVIEGVGRGVSGYIGERMTGRGRTTAEIKGERRKARAQFTPVGALHRAMASHVSNVESNRQVERESARENYKYKHDARRIAAETKAKQDERDAVEENYLAAVEANRQLGYDNVLGSGSAAQVRLHGYSTKRGAIKKLTTAELKGRTTALNDVKKLYGDDQTAAIKALYGAKTTKKTDPITNEEIEEEIYEGAKVPQPKPQPKQELPRPEKASRKYTRMTSQQMHNYIVSRGINDLPSAADRTDAKRGRVNYSRNMQLAIASQDVSSKESRAAVQRPYVGRHTPGYTVARLSETHLTSNSVSNGRQIPSGSARREEQDWYVQLHRTGNSHRRRRG